MKPHGQARSTLRRRPEFCSVIIHKYSVFYFEKTSFYVKNNELKWLKRKKVKRFTKTVSIF